MNPHHCKLTLPLQIESRTCRLRADGSCDKGRRQSPPMKLRSLSFIVSLCLLAGCETMPQGIQQARLNMATQIQAEPPGDYFIGRRYYKPDYHFWGYVRRPG